MRESKARWNDEGGRERETAREQRLEKFEWVEQKNVGVWGAPQSGDEIDELDT